MLHCTQLSAVVESCLGLGQFVTTAVAVLVGGVLIPPIAEASKRWWYSARLELVGSDDGVETVVDTQARRDDINGDYLPARYIRLAFKNRGNVVAKNCRAFLIDVTQNMGKPLIPPYCDTLRLRAAYEPLDQGQNYGVDIPVCAQMHFDVFSIQQGPNYVFEFASAFAMESPVFLNRLQLGQCYELSVIVTCETTRPVAVCVSFAIDENQTFKDVQARVIQAR